MEKNKVNKDAFDSNQSVRLTQAIPHLGKIQVDLLEPAASIYKVFNKENEKENEIKRLHGLMQLGLLSRIHSGAHHTRWDYIILKLYLLKIFKDACPGSGLSSKVPCLNLDSGYKAIQAYILLRNFGHLEGCFETERLVLESCVEHTHVRDILLELIPYGFRKWGMQLIADESIFKFYQLLAVILVANVSEFKNEEKLRKDCLSLLYMFLVKPDNKIQILKDRHREIRTLAYLALDMHYAVTGLEFNLGAILLGAKEFGRKMFMSTESPFKNLTRQIDSYIGDTVYRTSDATWLFLEYKRQMYLKITRVMPRFNTSKGFFRFIIKLKRMDYGFEPKTRPVYVKLLLGIENEYREPDKIITQARKLTDRLKINPTDLGLACVPSQTSSHIYIFFRPNLIKRGWRIAQTYRLILEELIVSRDTFYGGRPPVVSSVPFREMSISMDSIFRSILYLLTNDEYEIIIDSSGLYAIFRTVCERSKGEAQKRMDRIIKLHKFLPDNRKAELECVATTLQRAYGGYIAICLGNIKILRKPEYQRRGEEREAAEIDGAVLIANKRHTKLLLVESKTTYSGSSTAARRQLEELPQKVKFAEVFKGGFEEIVLLPRRGAYWPIRLP